MHVSDLTQAIASYPEDHVEIRIVNFDSDGPHINVGENASFQIEIENNGDLDMENVKFHVEASRYALVSQTDILGAPINFASWMITAPLQVSAGGTVRTRTFYMHAQSATPEDGTSNEELVSAHLSNWDASLDSLLRRRAAHSSNPRATYVRHIHPD